MKVRIKPNAIMEACGKLIGLLSFQAICAVILIEPTHSKEPIIRSSTSEDSDQPAYPRCLIRVFADRMCCLQPSGCSNRNK